MLRYLLHITNFNSPLLRNVIPVTALAFGLQTAVGIPSCIKKTEKYFDISGSATYIACTALSLALPALRARYAGGILSNQSISISYWDWRQLALSAAVVVWAARLGTHLFTRIVRDGGEDSRFDQIRGKPAFLFSIFMAQGAWVSLCTLPVTALNALPASAIANASPVAGALSIAGLGIWVLGLALEVAADRQKSAWLKAKKEKKHSEDFLTTGFWSRMRYPNYTGEISLWAGLAISAAAILASGNGLKALGWPVTLNNRLLIAALTAASPGGSAFILIKGSGVPPSERKYDQKYGHRKDYRQWRDNTPMIIPKFG